MEVFLGIFIAFIGLSFLVFFHELGHFLFAKLFKVKVNIFSIGFGKAIIKKKIGETEYRFSIFPLGGYVLMKGENQFINSNEIDISQNSYANKKPWQKILILFGGPLFNFILAFILFIFLGLSGIEILAPVVGSIVENSPASKYNIQKQDKIIKINETEIKDWKDIFPNLQQNNNGKIDIVILRNNQKIFLNIQLDKNPKNNTWFLGITPDVTKLNIVKYNFLEAVQFGYDSVTKFTLLLIDGVKQLITNTIGLNQLGGFISIIDYTSKASEIGLNSLFFMLAFLSINLAVLNLLPIPALDGGQIILVVYEIIRGKQANEKIYYYLIAFSWIFLISLMLIGVINDINRLVE